MLSALLLVVVSPVAANAETVKRGAEKSGSFPCTGDERITFRWMAQGRVSYQWREGPGHLGYKWKSAPGGQSLSMVGRTASINRKYVHSARVVSRSFQGRAPRINYAYVECANY